MKSSLIWFLSSHCNDTLRNYHLLIFGVIPKKTIQNYVKRLLNYFSISQNMYVRGQGPMYCEQPNVCLQTEWRMYMLWNLLVWLNIDFEIYFFKTCNIYLHRILMFHCNKQCTFSHLEREHLDGFQFFHVISNVAVNIPYICLIRQIFFGFICGSRITSF